MVDMSHITVKVQVEDLPLYTDMAEFIAHLAQGEDATVPAYVTARARELVLQIQAVLAKRAPAERGDK